MTLMMEPTSYLETSVISYQSTLCNIPEEQRSAFCLSLLEHIGCYVRQTLWPRFVFIFLKTRISVA
jgi:hypothetical protein